MRITSITSCFLLLFLILDIAVAVPLCSVHFLRVLSQNELLQKPIFQAHRKLAKAGLWAQIEKAEEGLKSELFSRPPEILGKMGGRNVSESFIVRDSSGTLWIWKPETISDPIDKSIHQVSNAEVMAYVVDRKLKSFRVPLTVYGKLKNRKGTFQLVVGNLNLKTQRVNFPDILKGFDYLIGNRDRTRQNYLITEDGSVIAIDNGNSANSWVSPQIPRTTMRIENILSHLKNDDFADPENDREAYIQELQNLVGQRSFYESLRSTNPEQWEIILSPHLNRGQQRNFLKRRLALLRAIEMAIELVGENAFYPK